MSVAQEQNWDEFLEKWPVNRVETMTLEEYSQVGNKDSFTYWLEQATRPIADIRGGDSSKFGIFNRKNAEEKENGRGRVYDGEYCWFEKYGTTKETAFQNIKDNILNIISAVKQRNLKAIETIPTSDMFKWKIAFLYQDRQNPQIIAIFWKAMLDFLTKNKKLGYAETYEKIMQGRHEQPLFEYNHTLLQAYFIANPKQSYLTPSEANETLSRKYPDSYISREKMTVVTNESGREIALVLTGSKASIFIEIDPEQNGKFGFNFKSTKDVPNGKYTEHDGRHSGLKSQSKNLWLGHQIYYIEIGTAEELEKFCDWYEQNSDQSNILESKVKAFLELWPIERLQGLTISDYHQAKNTACFISQVDRFDPTQGDPTMPCYFDIWEPIDLGDNDKYHNEKPYSWHKRLGDDSEQAFQQIKQEILNIVDAVQHRDLNTIDQIQCPKGLKWMIAFLYQDFNEPFIIPIVTETNIKRIGYTEFIKKPIPEFMLQLLADKGDNAFFPYVEKLFASIRQDYLNNKQNKSQSPNEKDSAMSEPLNRILFGAAGTGKTYNTINHALSILDNESLESLDNKDRIKLKADFDRYVEQGRIKFVTFHQSFSYEDFVEGIRAEADEGALSYKVKPGVFKEICEDAQIEIDAKQNNTLAPIEASINNAIEQLITQAKAEEIIFHTKRGVEIKVFSNSAGTLFALTSTGSNIPLSIRHIRNYLKIQSDIVVDQKSYEWAIAKSLRSEVKYEASVSLPKPFILIIDEINRGNISRIFGELITLIEDSKRAGAEEALSVTLPYSKKEFSVPNNVYIIGTMNSSDRSLTGLDIALRRRFTFIEMPPKPELLNDVVIEGLNVGKLLEVINQRIEVLLDRDHCIGHANFMSLKKQPTLEHLASIFKQKIIPQLQEYFFDDWSKINMVLNNNGMLQTKPVEKSVLFPNVDTDEASYFEGQKTWEMIDSAFDSIKSFVQIIKH